MYKFVSILILTALIVGACKKSDPPFFGYDYFPMEEGRFVEYDVMEILHDNDVGLHDTSRFILKTVVGEVILDNEGRAARKIYRYSYDKDSGDLIDQRVWTKVIDGGRAEIVEENQRKIRLVFAITLDKEWDVNAFNPSPEQNVYYDNIHNEFENIDSTVTVEYADELTLISYKRSFEVYGNHIGLIHRTFKDVEIANFDTTNVKSGTEQHYTLIDYGLE